MVLIFCISSNNSPADDLRFPLDSLNSILKNFYRGSCISFDCLPVRSRICVHFEQVFLEHIEPVGSDSKRTKKGVNRGTIRVKKRVNTENVEEEDLLQSFFANLS